MKPRLGIRPHILYLRLYYPYERGEHLAGGNPEVDILLRGLADHDGRIHRGFSVGYFAQVKNGEIGLHRIVTEMIAEGPFLPQHAPWNGTFEYEFRVCRNVKRNALALYHRHRASAKIARKSKLIHAVRERSDRGEDHPGISTEDYRGF